MTSALELLSLVNQALFVGLFVVVAWRAARDRSRASVDTAILFGSIAGAVVLSRIAGLAGMSGEPWVPGVLLGLLNAAPYAMIRLVHDFSSAPRWLEVAGGVAYIGVAALGLVSFAARPELVELVTIVWFLAIGGYAALAFARETRRTRGITRRRMGAVAIGAILFIAAIVFVFTDAILRGEGSVLGVAAQLAALVAVLAFFLGFAPPAWIRRAWREPDLRRFLGRSIQLVGLADERQAMTELQQAIAAAFGASGASIGVADPQRRVLRYAGTAEGWTEYPDDAFIAGRAYRQKRRVVATDAAAEDPGQAEVYERNRARAVIAAPLTIDERRIGVLAVFAERAPIFIEDDLWLLDLLAGHTAVLLEARALAAEAAGLRAREEAARLKEEFLSAAAHDLRTPLTVVLGQAELLERRLTRDPSAPVDLPSVSRIATEARRLRDLITELLDAQRLEQAGATMDRAMVDLREVLQAVRSRQLQHGLELSVEEPPGPLVGSVDRARLEQVMENLIENALKYSADAAPPRLRLWAEPGRARLAVIDHGIGIPEAERSRVFDRFYRATNAQSITDTGMGLGLYICRRIVEEHGGRIWVDATPGGGSTFHVSLPLPRPPVAPADPAPEAAWPAAPGTEALADA